MQNLLKSKFRTKKLIKNKKKRIANMMFNKTFNIYLKRIYQYVNGNINKTN